MPDTDPNLAPAGPGKLAGILAESMGFPLDDPEAMVAIALHHAIRYCREYCVSPIGTLTMGMLEASPWASPDRALRWELELA